MNYWLRHALIGVKDRHHECLIFELNLSSQLFSQSILVHFMQTNSFNRSRNAVISLNEKEVVEAEAVEEWGEEEEGKSLQAWKDSHIA